MKNNLSDITESADSGEKKKRRFEKLLYTLLVIFLFLLAGALGYIGTTWLSVRNQNQELAAVVKQFQQSQTATLNGQPVLGTIAIDKLGLEYPVIKYDEAKRSLDTAICAFAGPGLNHYGNTSLAGKRTKNGLFFANLGKLTANDTIQITDESGTTLTYRLIDSYTTSAEDKRIFEASFTEKVRELTLTSMSRDGASRYVFKFIEINSAE